MGETHPAKITNLFLGFGACAEAAAITLLRRGQPAHGTIVSTRSQHEAARAAALGLQVHDGPSEPHHPEARRVIIDRVTTEGALEQVRTARAMAPTAQICVVVEDLAQREIFLASGASDVVCVAALAGRFLAETVIGSVPVGNTVQ